MPWYLIDERFFCAFEVAADTHASGAAAATTRRPIAGKAPPPHHLIINDSPLCDMLLLPHHGIKASNKNSRTGKTSVVLLRLMYDFEVIIYPSYRNSIVVPLQSIVSFSTFTLSLNITFLSIYYTKASLIHGGQTMGGHLSKKAISWSGHLYELYLILLCRANNDGIFKAGNFGYLKTVYICVHTTHLASMHGMYRGAILQGT